MQVLLILSFIIAFLAIIFAIQNDAPVTIEFLVWETRGSLALVLFIALLAGASIAYLASAPAQIRRRIRISHLQKRLSELEAKIASTQPEARPEAEQAEDAASPGKS
jgi:putative membrane protein